MLHVCQPIFLNPNKQKIQKFWLTNFDSLNYFFVFGTSQLSEMFLKKKKWTAYVKRFVESVLVHTVANWLQVKFSGLIAC